jgi:hypothetical protein
MRRALASLLLALVSFPLIAPVFASDAASQLPACCRRDGKHHCSMLAEDMETPGPAFQAVRPKCPVYPTATSFSIQRDVAIVRDFQPQFASLITGSAVPSLTEARYRTPFSRSRQKRGPPSFIS